MFNTDHTIDASISHVNNDFWGVLVNETLITAEAHEFTIVWNDADRQLPDHLCYEIWGDTSEPSDWMVY